MQGNSKVSALQCLRCDEIFDFPSSKDDYLGHLYLSHRLVIADVEEISDLAKYLLYWVNAFKDHNLEEFCTTVLLDQLPDGTPSKNEKYYLLSDILPQDYELRKQLHNLRLEQVLAQYQFERSDRTFSRECLYCRDVVTGLRSQFIEHLFNKHFLQLGKAENLVFIDELINTIQNKLENLICIYCEKIFKDRVTLKEHMRKKGHKRINPNIRLYDKFFLINYKTEKPQNVRHTKQKQYHVNKKQSETTKKGQQNSDMYREKENILITEDSDSDWSDWDEEKQPLLCLYCPEKNVDFTTLKEHMLSSHEVDFDKQISSFNFYQKVKIVNYIRHQIHILKCVTCNERSNNLDELLEHMKAERHFGIGEKKQWNKPEFFFSTYEDDGVLCLLDDSIEDDLSESPVVIISEETRASVNKEAEQLSLENFIL